MHGPLQDIGATAGEGDHTHRQSEQQQQIIGGVETEIDDAAGRMADRQQVRSDR